jgi:hypothetical protein
MGNNMTEMHLQKFIASLAEDWGGYVAKYHALTPEEQGQFLQKQGYTRFADLLAHVVAWWLVCLKDLENFVENGEYSEQEIDVDAFNAEAVREFRQLDETAAIRSFEHTREALLDLLQMFQSLPDQARENPAILKRLEMETAGHYQEHAL